MAASLTAFCDVRFDSMSILDGQHARQHASF